MGSKNVVRFCVNTLLRGPFYKKDTMRILLYARIGNVIMFWYSNSTLMSMTYHVCPWLSPCAYKNYILSQYDFHGLICMLQALNWVTPVRASVDVNFQQLEIPWLGLKTCLSLSNLLLLWRRSSLLSSTWILGRKSCSYHDIPSDSSARKSDWKWQFIASKRQ